MRRLAVALLALAVVLPTAAPAQHKKEKPSAADMKPFIGTWKLVSTEEKLPDGTTRPYGFGPHGQGYLMYDATGHVCAQVANPDRPKWADPQNPTPAEIKTAFDGFGGYCGTYTIDAANHTMAHIPEVAFDPNIDGKPSPRSYKFEENRLIYTGTDRTDTGQETHWTMVWEKVQ